MFMNNAYEKKWNRIILSILWIALFIAFICHILVTNILSSHFPVLPRRLLIEESAPIYVVALSILLLLEWIARKPRAWAQTAIIVGTHGLALLVVLHATRDIPIAPVVFVFPLLVTAIFFRLVYWMFSIPISIAELAMAYWKTPSFDLNGIIAIIILSGIIAASYMAGLGVIMRGNELLESLRKSLASEQELLIQNTIMDRVSKMDPLTGLYNHKSFQQYLEKLIAPAQYEAYPFQLAVIDIDNFKQVNDTYGHAVGDVALKNVAGIIQQNLDPNDFAARYGGEEFVLLLREKSLDLAYSKLESVRKQIARTPIAEMNRSPVTVSIGLHAYAAGETKRECFEKADTALYESKNNGKNKTTIL